jgi:hypothetical protein
MAPVVEASEVQVMMVFAHSNITSDEGAPVATTGAGSAAPIFCGSTITDPAAWAFRATVEPAASRAALPVIPIVRCWATAPSAVETTPHSVAWIEPTTVNRLIVFDCGFVFPKLTWHTPGSAYPWGMSIGRMAYPRARSAMAHAARIGRLAGPRW